MFWYAPQTVIAGGTTRMDTTSGVADGDRRRDPELRGHGQW